MVVDFPLCVSTIHSTSTEYVSPHFHCDISCHVARVFFEATSNTSKVHCFKSRGISSGMHDVRAIAFLPRLIVTNIFLISGGIS